MERLTKEQFIFLLEAKPEERIYACENNFLAFFSYYFFHYLKSPFASFHLDMADDLVDLVSGKIKELGWFMFRESAKTSLSKGFLVWCIVYRKFEYINVDSHDKANSGRFLFDVVLELQTNQKIRNDFGDLFNAKRSDTEKTQKSVADFLTTNGVRVEAHSTQEPVRGRLHGSTRPQLILMDDFEDLTTVRSLAATRQVKEHIAEFKGGIDQEKGRILYLGNYLSEAGTVQGIMDRAKVDPTMRVRTVWILDDDGNPSWPERHALTDLEAQEKGLVSVEEIKRRMRTADGGDADFMREMMGKPFDPNLAKFRLEMFRSVSREEVDRMDTAAYLLIDPPGQAYTAESIRQGKGDFIGYSIVKVTPTGKWMVEAWRVRHTPREMIDTMFSIWSREMIIQIGMEDTQFWQGIKTLIEDEEVRRGTRLNIKELKHTSKASKSDRILSLHPRYDAGSIWHVQGKCTDLETELLRFPINEHDDCVDSLANAPEVVERPREKQATVSANPQTASAYRYGSARMAGIRNASN